MINYIVHVSLLLGLGFILYQLLLKKETFYSLNRVILASYIILAFSLPLIHIPESWSLKSVSPMADNLIEKESPITPIASVIPAQESRTPETNSIKKLNAISTSKLNTTDSNEMKNQKSETTPLKLTFVEKVQNTMADINWIAALSWVYFIGLSIFLINFLVQFFILIYYRFKYPVLKDGKLTIVEMEGDKAPFSFLNMIYINPSKYDYDTYEQILAHEKIHIEKWHSFDIFLSELALTALWFNPFAWMYRKIVEHNLEYLTDQEMLASGANAEAYQMNLLKVSVPELPLSLSTNYNQSFLKKRIHMMNAKKSSARSTWKYLFILPILGLTVALFNPTLINAQHTEKLKEQRTQNRQEQSIITETEYKEVENHYTEIHNEAEKILEKEMQIQEQVKEEEKITEENFEESTNVISELNMLEIDPDISLQEFKSNIGFNIVSSDQKTYLIDKKNDKTIFKSASEDLENEGDWEAELKKDNVCLHIKKGGIGKNYYWSRTECFLAIDFKPTIKSNVKGEFSMTRDPGTLLLKGEFNKSEGSGKYNFTPNANFITSAQREGFKISKEKSILFFLSGIEQSFFSFLKSNGYSKVSEDELLALAIHDVNEEYIKDINGEFKKANYDQPSVEELIAMKIHNVDMEYVKSFGKELYEDLDADQIVAAAIHNVDPKFISEFRTLGYDDLSFDNLISAAIHNVDVDYVKQLKGAGFEDMSFDNLIAAAIHNVDPDYIKKFQNAGFTDLTYDDMIYASIHNVDPEYITAFEQAGIDLDFNDLISASIHNIDVDYIKEFQNAGFNDLEFDDVVAAGIHNVDVDYLREAKSYGFDLTFDQLISASIHHVDLKYLEAFSKAGFDNLSFDDMISASIHHVDPKFIGEFKALGFDDLSFDNMIAASIHNIDPSYVKEVKAAGIEDISFEDIISFGIHNIDIDDIKGLQAMGFNLTADKMIEAGIHHITPKYIKKMQEKGYKDLDFDEYVKLKIHGF